MLRSSGKFQTHSSSVLTSKVADMHHPPGPIALMLQNLNTAFVFFMVYFLGGGVCCVCILACVCAAFETHQVECTEAYVGMWALWRVLIRGQLCCVGCLLHIYVLPRGWALVTKFAWKVSLPAKPSWWFCCLVFLVVRGWGTYTQACPHACTCTHTTCVRVLSGTKGGVTWPWASWHEC